MELKQCILAHSVTETAKLLQKFFKDKGLNTYILDKTEQSDFKYLLEDLGPQFFLIQGDLFLTDPELFSSQLNAFPQLSVGVVAKEAPSGFDWDFLVESPVDPAMVYDQIYGQLAQNLN